MHRQLEPAEGKSGTWAAQTMIDPKTSAGGEGEKGHVSCKSCSVSSNSLLQLSSFETFTMSS